MPTYSDIERAFVKYREDARELRKAAWDTGTMLFERVLERGCFSADIFKLHPSDPQFFNVDGNFAIQDAMKYNTEAQHWELGAVLKVSQTGSVLPPQYLRLTFTIKQTAGDSTVALWNSSVSTKFVPRQAEEAQRKLTEFADNVIEAIVSFYADMRNKWLDERDKVIGFSAN